MGGLVVGSGFPSFIGESEVGGQGAEPTVGGLMRQRIDYMRIRHDSPFRHGLLAFFPLMDVGVQSTQIHRWPPVGSEGQGPTYIWNKLNDITITPRGRAATRVTDPSSSLSLRDAILAAKPAQGTISLHYQMLTSGGNDLKAVRLGVDADNGIFLLIAQDGRLGIIHTSGGLLQSWFVTATIGAMDGRWHHVTWSSNGSAWRVTFDGREEALSAIVGSNSGAWSDDLASDTGAFLDQFDSDHDIHLSDLGFWDRELSLTECRQLYWEPDSIFAVQKRPVILDRFRMHPAGIGSSEAFGTPEAVHTLKPSAIASASAFGTAELVHILKMLGIASAEALGTPNVAYLLRPSGIASAEAHGLAELVHVLKFTGIPSASTFGTAELVHVLKMTGIGSAEALGSAELVHVLKLIGIAPGFAAGTPSLALVIEPSGIASAQAFGSPELVHILKMLGIPSASAFGLLVLTGPVVAALVPQIFGRARVGLAEGGAEAGGIIIALGQHGQLYGLARLGGPRSTSTAGDVAGEGQL